MRLQVEKLGKRFGSQRVLDDIDLDIGAGEIVAVIGLNGAGKTTLLRCLAGIIAPASGRILMDGAPFARGDLALRKRLLFLPDFPVFVPGHHCLAHLAMIARLYGREADIDAAAVAGVLADFDLLAYAASPLATLSRGQAYKAALAGLFLARPGLWLLDEPFASGMDPQGLTVLKTRARAAAQSGTTILYTTQILEIAERFCTRLVVIDRGRLKLVLTRADLAAMPASGRGSLEDRLGEFRELPR
jgi:ABC-type multidrug transport system ATPase subunit